MRERMIGNEIRDVGRGWTVLSHEKTGSTIGHGVTKMKGLEQVRTS